MYCSLSTGVPHIIMYTCVSYDPYRKAPDQSNTYAWHDKNAKNDKKLSSTLIKIIHQMHIKCLQCCCFHCVRTLVFQTIQKCVRYAVIYRQSSHVSMNIGVELERSLYNESMNRCLMNAETLYDGAFMDLGIILIYSYKPELYSSPHINLHLSCTLFFQIFLSQHIN